MRQAIHIFKKDARHLRAEIVLLLMALFLYVSMELRPAVTGPFWSVRQVAAWISVGLGGWLTVRLVQAEALPGDRQFWLTRPYSWKSLLVSKCLFLGAFVLVPLMLSDIVMMKHWGFAVTDYLPGLVWEQVLRIAVVGVPVLALCSVIRNPSSWVFAALALEIAYAVVSYFFFPGITGSWEPLSWIGELAAGAMALAGCGAIVAWQYARRRTGAARLALGGIASVLMLTPFFPTQLAMAIQTRGEQKVVDPAAVRVEVDPTTPIQSTPLGFMRIPLRVSGVPEGYRIWADQIHLKIRSEEQDGEESLGGESALENGFWLAQDRSHAILELRNGPIETMLRGSALFTVGKERQTTAVMEEHLTRIDGLGLCQANPIAHCERPFGGPRLIAATPREAYVPSYSPLPAELHLDPVQNSQFQTEGIPYLGSKALTLAEPVQHFFVDFDLGDVRLDRAVTAPDFAEAAQ